MATEDKRIDQLPGGSVYPENLLVMDQNGTAVQITLQQLLQFVVNGWGEQIVKYVSQTPTEEQQYQARKNIRCGSVGDVSNTCNASGTYSSAEGQYTDASGNYSHSEGHATTASGSGAHSEGEFTMATRIGAHSEGSNTKASGYCAHSEGRYTEASGTCAHSEGEYTTANRKNQHVQGMYNVIDETGDNTSSRGKYVHIVGNGTDEDNRSNAHTLDWEGVPWYAGDRVMLGGTGMDDENAVALMPIFAPQQLTEEQKQQARENIGAVGEERIELITQFQLTENVRELFISADADGNPFRLEKVVVTLNTNGKCDAGDSGAFTVYIGTLENVHVLGLYFMGFPFRGYETSAGKYRNSGFNAYGSVKGGVGLAVGYCGDYGNSNSNADYLGNMASGYCGEMKIEQIRVGGTMPKNATISVYGVKAVD